MLGLDSSIFLFLKNNIADLITSIQSSKPQTVHTYGTDSVAALAAYKIVLFELRRSNDVAKVKLIRYRYPFKPYMTKERFPNKRFNYSKIMPV